MASGEMASARIAPPDLVSRTTRTPPETNEPPNAYEYPPAALLTPGASHVATAAETTRASVTAVIRAAPGKLPPSAKTHRAPNEPPKAKNPGLSSDAVAVATVPPPASSASGENRASATTAGRFEREVSRVSKKVSSS